MNSTDKRCGTCQWWGEKVAKKLKVTICLMSGKTKHQGDMKGCWGWKPRTEPVHVPHYLR
jgi:hypothetical protein